MLTLSAHEAAARLGVKPATLYTYVSRGWLTSLPGPNRRSRRYLSEEVDGLAARAAASRGRGPVAAEAMGWGQPVVDTALAHIGPDGLSYRGRPVDELVEAGFEQTCAWLWELAEAGQGSPWSLPLVAPGGPKVAAPLRLGAWLAQGAVHGGRRGGATDPVDHELSAGLDLIGRAAAALAPGEARARGSLGEEEAPRRVAEILAEVLGNPDATEVLDAALVLCAEHELNASTFAVRVATSTGAGLLSCLSAGMATLSGARHGAASESAEALLDAAAELGPSTAVREWARGGGPMPGLGHRLYPDGDPRFVELRELARRRGGGPLDLAEAVLKELRERGHPLPNLDLGLVLLRRAWGLPRGSAQAVFAVGRMAGWMAHHREEALRGRLIRPRARYIGP